MSGTSGKTGEKATSGERIELREEALRGVRLCRKGHYEESLETLEGVLSSYRDEVGRIPARLLSYYGVCLAETRGQVKDGLQYVRTAIKTDPFHADHYANLARVYIAGRSRGKAVGALQKASKFDGDNTLVSNLWGEIGNRGRPSVPFLKRDHPVNVMVGRMRRSSDED